MLAAVEQMAARLLDEFDRPVDGDGRPVRKVNAEVIDTALTADAGAFLIGHGEVKRERVFPVWRAHERNIAITKVFFHAEHLSIEGNGPRLVSDQKMDMSNPDRSQDPSSATEPCNC